MYSMPGSWAERQLERLVGRELEHPLATTQQHVAWENAALRVECNLVRNHRTLEDRLAVRIVPAVEPSYSAVVVALAPDGRLHVVGRYRYATSRWSIEFPRFEFESGDAGWKESAEADLFRITGLKAAKMSLLGAIEIDPALLSTSSIIILAEGCRLAVSPKRKKSTAKAADLSQGEPAPEHDELVAGCVALPLTDLYELVAGGEITCGVTLAALSLYRARLR
jgi:hypothetical protein